MRRTGLALVGLVALIGWSTLSTVSRGSWFQVGATVLVLVGAVVFLAVLLTRRENSSDSVGRSHADILLICWVLVSLLPAHNFAGQSAADAVKSATTSSILELAYFSVVAVLALRIIRERTPSLGSAVVPLRLFLFPVWVISSGFWSGQAPYSMIRGIQFFMIGILGWATVAVLAGNPAVRDQLLRRFMFCIVVIVGALAVSGFVFGTSRAKVAAVNEDRFSWIGAHPNSSGPLIITALLIVVIAGDHIRLPMLARLPFGALFVAAIYSNQSRASLLGLAGATVIVLVRAIRDNPRALAAAAPFAATAAFLVAVFRWDAIMDYLSRGQSSETLASGNGRMDLWRIGFESLDGPFDWLAGHGYGITRTIFLPEAPWAGEAHNSVLAALIGLGLVGVVLLLGLYATWIWDIARSPEARSSPLVLTLVAVVIAGFLAALFTDRIAEPSDGYAVLILLSAVVYASARVPKYGDDDARRAESELVPASS